MAKRDFTDRELVFLTNIVCHKKVNATVVDKWTRGHKNLKKRDARVLLRQLQNLKLPKNLNDLDFVRDDYMNECQTLGIIPARDAVLRKFGMSTSSTSDITCSNNIPSTSISVPAIMVPPDAVDGNVTTTPMMENSGTTSHADVINAVPGSNIGKNAPTIDAMVGEEASGNILDTNENSGTTSHADVIDAVPGSNVGENAPTIDDATVGEASENNLDDRQEFFDMGSNVEYHVSFRMLLASWAVMYHIPRSYVTALLKLLHASSDIPTMLKKQIPTDCRALLSDTLDMRRTLKLKKIYKEKKVAWKRAGTKRNRDALQSNKVVVGNYVHFGLMKGLMGRSPGVCSTGYT